METSPEFVKISDLSPRSRRVNLKVKVIGKGDVREVTSSRDGSSHKVAEATVGDETGTVLMTLWDKHIDEISVGDILKISNGYVSLFRGTMRLNIGRYGTFEKVEGEEDLEVNEENNVSLREYSQPRRRSFGDRGRSGGRSYGGGWKRERQEGKRRR